MTGSARARFLAGGSGAPVRPGPGRPASARVPEASDIVPRFNTFGLLLALLGAGVLPLAMFLTYARERSGSLRLAPGGSLLLRYPLATFLGLADRAARRRGRRGVRDPVHGLAGGFRFLLLELFPGLRVLRRSSTRSRIRQLQPAVPARTRGSTTFISGGSIRVTRSSPPSRVALVQDHIIRASLWTLELTDGE